MKNEQMVNTCENGSTEQRGKLRNRHASLKEKVEDEIIKCKKELKLQCRIKTSTCEERINFIEKMRLEQA